MSPLSLAMFMSLKEGKQTCPKCQGDGCYSCQRSGAIVVCPQCRSQDEMVTKDGNEYHCHVCGTKFSSSGEITDPYASTER